MTLIGIKKNWSLLGRGSEFREEETVIQSRSSEGIRIVNHPNKKKPPFPHRSWLDADGVEVWNTVLENSPFRKLSFLKTSNNRKAFKQWADSLKEGKRYTAMAGSDFHFIIPCFRDRTLHYPANFIPSHDISQVKQNIEKGNISFLTGPKSPKLNLRARFNNSEWSPMGSELSGKGTLQVELLADYSDSKKRLKSACYKIIMAFSKIFTLFKKNRLEVRFYNMDGEVVAKKKFNGKKFGGKRSFSARVDLPITGTDLIRAELWEINRKEKQINLLASTNPIYINR